MTEVMTNPAAQSDSAGEYFEVMNTGSAPLDLQGTVFRDLGSNSFTITDSIVVATTARAVLGRSITAADGAVDYVYGSAMSLSNASDQIIIERDGIVLDSLAWDSTFPLVAGAAMELLDAAPSASTNDEATSWCASASPLADGDFGTPGLPPSTCADLP